MSHLAIELSLWMLLMFFIGCILSCLLRKILATEQNVTESSGAAKTQAVPDPAPRPAAQEANPTPPTAVPVSARLAYAKPVATESEPPEPVKTPLSTVPSKEAEDDKATAPEETEKVKAATPAATVAVEPEKKEPAETIVPATPSAEGESAPSDPAPKPAPQVETTPVGDEHRPKGLASARDGKADNLQQIYGIGPKLEKVLHDLGFFHFSQIAEWTSQEEQWVDEHLQFKGRIGRDEWIAQAKLLAVDDMTQFRQLYGSGGQPDADGQTKPGSRTRRGRNMKS